MGMHRVIDPTNFIENASPQGMMKRGTPIPAFPPVDYEIPP